MQNTDQNTNQNTQNNSKDNSKHVSIFMKWRSLFFLTLAVAIVVIDGTVLNVSISKIVQDLGTDLKSIQWAITTYSLVLAALTIFGGRLGDIFGRKKMFVTGAIIFGFGSLMTALAPNINFLILGWSIIEGIGAALMIPASSSLIVSNYQGKDRGIAFGFYGATAGAASSIGPILGGLLTSTFSWRFAFGINLVVVAGLVLGSVFIKDYAGADSNGKIKKISLDYFGVILSSLGLASLTYGIIESSVYGWIFAKKAWEFAGNTVNLASLSISFYSILLGLALLVGFVFWENFLENTEGKDPLISMSIFLNRQFSAGIAVISILFAGFSGILTFGIVLFYQYVLKLDALNSGIGLIPLSLGTLIVSPLSARLANKIGPKITIQLGLLTTVIATILLYFSLNVDATRITLIPALAVFGIGFGLIVSQLTNLILSSVPNSQAGEASGINGTIREVGRTIGTALIGSVFLASFSSSATAFIQNDAAIPNSAKAALVANFNQDQINLGNSNADNSKPNPLANQITKLTNQAIVDGSKASILYTMIFMILCLGMSFTLPTKKEI